MSLKMEEAITEKKYWADKERQINHKWGSNFDHHPW